MVNPVQVCMVTLIIILMGLPQAFMEVHTMIVMDPHQLDMMEIHYLTLMAHPQLDMEIHHMVQMDQVFLDMEIHGIILMDLLLRFMVILITIVIILEHLQVYLIGNYQKKAIAHKGGLITLPFYLHNFF
jgi:hypothetical protein